MSEETNDGASLGGETGSKAEGAGGNAVGKALREARTAANIDVNKICTDLRISPQALEALEEGNYHLLPGDPYIRALLGSLGRYLGLDPTGLVQRYNKEIGAVPPAPSIAPYKDRTQTHTTAHKQIFIGIFAVLFIVLFFLFRKLGTDETAAGAVVPPAADTAISDSLSAAEQDTGLESQSLAPDSNGSGSAEAEEPDSEDQAKSQLKPIAPPASAPAPAAKTPAPAPANPESAEGASAPAGATAPAAIDSSHLILAVVKPLVDSVGVKVLRYGKEDFATVLRLGKQMQVSHTDTITILVSKRKAVEVTVGGKSVIPNRKRFKIFGNTLKTF